MIGVILWVFTGGLNMELGVALVAQKCSELAFYVHLHYGISFSLQQFAGQER